MIIVQERYILVKTLVEELTKKEASDGVEIMFRMNVQKHEYVLNRRVCYDYMIHRSDQKFG